MYVFWCDSPCKGPIGCVRADTVGKQVMSQICADAQKLRIRYSGDEGVVRLSFPGVISATCPRSSYKDLNDTLQSPGYGTGNYPANQTCTYNVTVPAGKRIILAFDLKRFNILESMPDCLQDSLDLIVG